MLRKCLKFSSAVKTWLLFKRISVKDSTYYRYKYIVDKYILKYFKDKRLYKLKKIDFNSYIEMLSEELSSETVKNILTIFKSILKFLETKYNLKLKLDLINTPKAKKHDIEILKTKDINKLEGYCYSTTKDFEILGIQFAIATGMRIGEICALKWKNVDLKRGFVSVTNTLQRVYIEKGKTTVLSSEPKSFSSKRRIPIPKKLLEHLREVRRSHKFCKEAFVLTGEKERFIEPRLLERYFVRILKKLNMKNYKFHSLRHTYATNCINLGMDPKALSILLGHSSTNITLNRYVHPDIESQRKFLNQL